MLVPSVFNPLMALAPISLQNGRDCQFYILGFSVEEIWEGELATYFTRVPASSAISAHVLSSSRFVAKHLTREQRFPHILTLYGLNKRLLLGNWQISLILPSGFIIIQISLWFTCFYDTKCFASGPNLTKSDHWYLIYTQNVILNQKTCKRGIFNGTATSSRRTEGQHVCTIHSSVRVHPSIHLASQPLSSSKSHY